MQRATHLLLLVLTLLATTKLLAQDVADKLHRSIGVFNPAELYVTDIAVDSTGNIHAVDYFHRTITKYSPTGTIVTRFVDEEAHGLPRRIALDEHGTMYVVYDGWNKIGVYTAEGKRLRYLTVDWGYSKTTGIAVRSGKLYATSSADGSIPRIYDANNGSLIAEVLLPKLPGNTVRRPADVVVANDGTIYIMDRGAMRIERYDSLGRFLSSIVFRRGQDPGEIVHLTAIAVDANHNIYVSDRYNFSVSKFTSSGEFLLRIGKRGKGPGHFDQHLGIAYSSLDDTIWVAGYHNHDIQQFNAAGDVLSYWTAFESGPGDFSYAEGVVATADRIYIADRYNQRVQVFDKANGEFLFSFGQRGDHAASGDMEFPRALGLDLDGNVYVAEYRRIKQFSADGQYLSHYDYRFPNSGRVADIKGSQGLVVTPGKILFFTDRANRTIDKRNSTNGKYLRPLGGAIPQGLVQPWGIAFSKTRRQLYATDSTAKLVVVLGRMGEFVMQWSTPTKPYGVAIDDDNAIVYVGGVNRIFAYSLDGRLLRSWDGRNANQKNSSSNITFGHLFVDALGDLYASDMVGTVNVYRRRSN